MAPPPTPSTHKHTLLLSSPQAAEYRPLPQTAATLPSYTVYNGAQIYSGEERPAPLLPCSLTLVSCPSYSVLFLPVALFLSLAPFLVPLTPFLPTGASFLLLCSASPGPGVWAVLIAREGVAAYPSACPGPANEERGAEVLIHNNNH